MLHMDTLSGTFGQKVRRLRKEKGLYQHELAGRARISAQTVRNVESGRHPPSMATATKIAKALDVSVGELLD